MQAKAAKASKINMLQDAAVNLRTASMFGYSQPAAERALDLEVEKLHQAEREGSRRSAIAMRSSALQMLKGLRTLETGGRLESSIKMSDAWVEVRGVRCELRTPSFAELVRPHQTCDGWTCAAMWSV